MDLALVDAVARRRPDWHWVFIGPTAKIDPRAVPQRPNIHYLGMKPYDALPDYLSGWDVAVLPFAHNAATRFISPTKTPEYLAAGCPVVSTSIRDVVHPYGDAGFVHIADDHDSFIAATESALRESRTKRLQRVDAFLAGSSWDAVVRDMNLLMNRASRAGRVAHSAAVAPSGPRGSTSAGSHAMEASR
jgi:glycosyltransferase involved in cell wall biosynthesis